MFQDVVGIPLSVDVLTHIGLVWKKGKYQNKGMRDFLKFCKSYYTSGFSTNSYSAMPLDYTHERN